MLNKHDKATRTFTRTEYGLGSSKRSQSEAVGFVVIILIVVIAGVIFLGITLRNKSSVITEDATISNFLSASLNYKTSTSCYKDSEPFYRSLGDIAGECYKQSTSSSSLTCPNNEMPCDYLNRTYSEMLSRFMPAGTLNSYSLSFTYNSSALRRTFKEIKWANSASNSCLGGKRAGRSYINTGVDEEIIIELQICSV